MATGRAFERRVGTALPEGLAPLGRMTISRLAEHVASDEGHRQTWSSGGGVDHDS
jgi:hypothetical protein